MSSKGYTHLKQDKLQYFLITVYSFRRIVTDSQLNGRKQLWQNEKSIQYYNALAKSNVK
jgi:hypothetical protein